MVDLSMFPVNLIGIKNPNPMIHCCASCTNPILIYGRMIPCKHVFCYDCAIRCETKCIRCKTPVERIEKCEPGQVFMCSVGAPKHSPNVCGRTYLSQRDLDAHTSHRHKTKPASSNTSSASAGEVKKSTLITIPLQKK